MTTETVQNAASTNGSEPLLRADNVSKTFVAGTFRKHYTHALDTVTFSVPESPPTITAIAGESGSGKTTLARTVLGLVEPTSGEVIYRGNNVAEMSRAQHAEFRREVQVIFQDPFESYNPFYKVDHVLRTPIRRYKLASSKSEADDIVVDALRTVGLRPEETLGRHPHQLSGGQRQRVMVARAVMLKPKIIVADEPVSMVDASLRATILETLSVDEPRPRHLDPLHHARPDDCVSRSLTTLSSSTKAALPKPEASNPSSTTRRIPYTQLLVSSIPQPDPDTQWGQGTGNSRRRRDRANRLQLLRPLPPTYGRMHQRRPTPIPHRPKPHYPLLSIRRLPSPPSPRPPLRIRLKSRHSRAGGNLPLSQGERGANEQSKFAGYVREYRAEGQEGAGWGYPLSLDGRGLG